MCHPDLPVGASPWPPPRDKDSSVGRHEDLGMAPKVSVVVNDALEDTNMETVWPDVERITDSSDPDPQTLLVLWSQLLQLMRSPLF